MGGTRSARSGPARPITLHVPLVACVCLRHWHCACLAPAPDHSWPPAAPAACRWSASRLSTAPPSSPAPTSATRCMPGSCLGWAWPSPPRCRWCETLRRASALCGGMRPSCRVWTANAGSGGVGGRPRCACVCERSLLVCLLAHEHAHTWAPILSLGSSGCHVLTCLLLCVACPAGAQQDAGLLCAGRPGGAGVGALHDGAVVRPHVPPDAAAQQQRGIRALRCPLCRRRVGRRVMPQSPAPCRVHSGAAQAPVGCIPAAHGVAHGAPAAEAAAWRWIALPLLCRSSAD